MRQLGIGLLATVVLGLLVLNVLAWSGGLVEDEAQAPATASTPKPVADPPPPAREPPEPIARKQPVKRTAQPTRISLTISATRGDCWVEVRAGSATGTMLYAGTLPTGRTIKFSRPKVWLRLGAASHVDVVVNGEQSTVPPGTVELLLPDA